MSRHSSCAKETDENNELVSKDDWEQGSLTSLLARTDAWGETNQEIRKSNHPLLICAGHGRTGTTSLTMALEMLGLSAEHYTPSTLAISTLVEKNGAIADADFSNLENLDAVSSSMCLLPKDKSFELTTARYSMLRYRLFTWNCWTAFQTQKSY